MSYNHRTYNRYDMNLVFLEGLLGFCLASIFFVVATICQIYFTVNFRLLADMDEPEHTKKIKKLNTDMLFGSVKIFFAILLTFAFCLPIAVLTLSYFNSNYGLVIDSWILFGSLFATVAFLLTYCIYKIFVLNVLINKEIVWLDEQSVYKVNTESKILKKICIVFAIGFAIIMLATYIYTSLVSELTFIERERFDNPDKFIEYMQSEYDAWYDGERHGYPPAPPNDESLYPNRKWEEIDGKQYYYNPTLYASITVHQHTPGEWEIVVTTNIAYQNGKDMYSILNACLLSLHIINLAVCVIWYILKIKNHKTEKNRSRSTT